MPNLTIEKYSDKGFTVRGDTKPHTEKFKAMGGRYNNHLEGGPGWVFGIKNRWDSVSTYVRDINRKKFVEGLQKNDEVKMIVPSRKRERDGLDNSDALKRWKHKKIEKFKKESDSIIEKERQDLEFEFQQRHLELEDMFSRDRKDMEQEFDAIRNELEARYEARYEDYAESFLNSTYPPLETPTKISRKTRLNLWSVITMITMITMIAFQNNSSIRSNTTEFIQQVSDSVSMMWVESMTSITSMTSSITKMNEQIIPNIPNIPNMADIMNRTIGIYHGTESFPT